MLGLARVRVSPKDNNDSLTLSMYVCVYIMTRVLLVGCL